MIINLDEIAPDDKTVILGGKTLLLPTDLPLKLMLQILKCQQKLQENPSDQESMEISFKLLYDSLCVKNEIEFEWFMNTMTIPRFVKLSTALYEQGGEKKTLET